MSGTVALPEGPDSDWPPPLLLATSVGASLLNTFIDLARRVRLPVLGLATQQRVELDAQKDVAAVIVTVRITVPTKAAAADAHTVWMRALREASVPKAVSCRIVAEPSFVVLSDVSCASEGGDASGRSDGRSTQPGENVADAATSAGRPTG
jgi:hypothetical protein